jgi:hypothetical protein
MHPFPQSLQPCIQQGSADPLDGTATTVVRRRWMQRTSIWYAWPSGVLRAKQQIGTLGSQSIHVRLREGDLIVWLWPTKEVVLHDTHSY